MLGVGVQRDVGTALALIAYNLMNTEYEYLKTRGTQMLYFLRIISEEEKNTDEVMDFAAKSFSILMSKCIEKKSADSCMTAFLLSDVVPNRLTTVNHTLAIDWALKMAEEDVEKYQSASKFAPMFVYYAKMAPDQQISDSNANPPKQTPSQSAAPQYQNDGKKYKFTDGFSIDVNSGIVVDAIYGLAWQDAAEIFKGSYKDAVSYCENLNYGGYSDWRLPSASELLSITDYGRYKPAINKAFKHVGKDGSDKYGSYWSLTGASFDAGGVWVVQFGSGFDNWVKINLADNFARCVRNLK